MGEAKRRKGTGADEGPAEGESLIVERVARQLHRAFTVEGACYRTTLFLQYHLARAHGIRGEAVIGYINDGTGDRRGAVPAAGAEASEAWRRPRPGEEGRAGVAPHLPPRTARWNLDRGRLRRAARSHDTHRPGRGRDPGLPGRRSRRHRLHADGGLRQVVLSGCRPPRPRTGWWTAAAEEPPQGSHSPRGGNLRRNGGWMPPRARNPATEAVARLSGCWKTSRGTIHPPGPPARRDPGRFVVGVSRHALGRHTDPVADPSEENGPDCRKRDAAMASLPGPPARQGRGRRSPDASRRPAER